MKPVLKICAVLVVAMITAQGCYKDKGNYTYTNATVVTITASMPDTINVLLQDSLKIATTITSSKAGASSYSYEWVMYIGSGTALTRNNLSTQHDLAARITDAPGRYVLNYFVTDNQTGIIYKKAFVVNIASALNEGWLVVEEKNGACDMNMIGSSGTVFRNIYSGANNGAKLPAGTNRVAIVRDRLNVQKIYVMSPAAAEQLYFANFVKLNNFADWFYQAPAVAKPQEYFISGGGSGSDERLVNNGEVYAINTNSAGTMKFGLPPVGTYDIAPFEIYSVLNGHVWFDKLTQRFYKQDVNYFNFSPFAAPGVTSAFNMNAINKKLLYAAATSGSSVFNCLFVNNTNDSVFNYRLEMAKSDPAAVVDTLGVIPGVLTANQFVMSRKLNFVYYTSGNQVYLLDIPARKARVIYTFATGTQVRAMKLYYNNKSSSDADNYNVINIATNEGGEGKVYQFALAPTGDFANNTYRTVYGGFGLINEITYKSAP